MEPQIIIQNYQGRHNSDLGASANRLKNANSYKDLSAVCIIPNSGTIPAIVAERWLNLQNSMNQKFIRIILNGTEKYSAYNIAIEQILANPFLNSFKYIITLEENIIPPFDGLLKLFEDTEKYDVVGGLIWTADIEARSMIYGNPKGIPSTYTPQFPKLDTIQECNGLGTGFTLFKIDIFKNKKVPKPWFRIPFQHEQGKPYDGAPDMYFFENIHKLGYKVACDTRIKVGNYDAKNDIVW